MCLGRWTMVLVSSKIYSAQASLGNAYGVSSEGGILPGPILGISVTAEQIVLKYIDPNGPVFQPVDTGFTLGGKLIGAQLRKESVEEK